MGRGIALVSLFFELLLLFGKLQVRTADLEMLDVILDQVLQEILSKTLSHFLLNLLGECVFPDASEWFNLDRVMQLLHLLVPHYFLLPIMYNEPPLINLRPQCTRVTHIMVFLIMRVIHHFG